MKYYDLFYNKNNIQCIVFKIIIVIAIKNTQKVLKIIIVMTIKNIRRDTDDEKILCQ
jgi:hypothetical protein